jgi:hypothetical protein
MPAENTATHGEAIPEPEHAMPAPMPVYAPPEDHAAQAANTANRATKGNAPPASPAPAKLGSNLTTVILKIAFVALLGLSLCVAATGVIMAIAFGLKSGRTQR